MARVRLNQTSLREQSGRLQTMLSFLPTLELRKQQLEGGARELEEEARAASAALAEHADTATPWLPLLRAELDAVRQLAGEPCAHTAPGQRAGVDVPTLVEVTFASLPYSRLGTPVLFDAAVPWLQEGHRLRIAARLSAEQLRLVRVELRRTTQRINLYEQVLVPEARQHIKRIRAHLSDQVTAAVCRAKLAKGRRVRRQRGGSDGGG